MTKDTHSKRSPKLRGSFFALYSGLLLLTLHWAIVVYINSSYLEQFVSAKTVSTLYIVGALITIVAFLNASRLLTRIGNLPLTVILTIVEFITLLGMAFNASPVLAIILFVIHQAVVPILLFNLDVFMEELIGNKEESTGGRRGFLLALASLTTALAALGMGKLVGDGIPHFDYAYIAAAVILIPFLALIVVCFKNFKDPQYPHLRVMEGLRKFWKFTDVRNVFFAHFLLQLFFTWMVIYTPLYFSTKLGFTWEQIGSILSVAMMAYVFFEYGIGVIADTYIGEKEMMVAGFIIMGFSTASFIYLEGMAIGVWMFAMFMTRVGASLVETTTESYFFKHTQSKDTNLIGLFRMTRPLASLIGAVLGSLTLIFLPFNQLFLVLGICMIVGIIFAVQLKDTK